MIRRRVSFLSAPAVRDESGQALVEFAIVLPLLIAVVLGIVQFGIAYNNYVTLTNATRVGARKAAVSRFLGDSGASAQAATVAAAPNLKLKTSDVIIAVSPGGSWTTPGSDVSVSASYPFSISILGWVVKSGNLTSSTHERLE
jgi:Flp pilus assembly protein TadG